MNFEQAVALLYSTDTWCKGAKMLAETGDERALLHLINAYELPDEADRLCLLEAMEKLDPIRGAKRLFTSLDRDTRVKGLHLMELFPHDSHVPILADAINSADMAIRRQAARSLLCQRPGEQWEKLLLSMLSNQDPFLRKLAIEGLQYRHSSHALNALHDQLACEKDRDVIKRLYDALQPKGSSSS